MVTNLNNEHFDDSEKNMVNDAWAIIMKVLNNKARVLTPEKRRKYGSIKEENKLVVQKVLEYNQNQPHLNSPEVDYAELQADWTDRMFLAGLVSKMVEATYICNNIRITHDYDAFQNARVDYKYTKYKLETGSGSGFESKYYDLLYFFKSYGSLGETDAEVPADAQE